MQLEINGKVYETKFNYGFYHRIVDGYSNDKDADGFNLFIGGLVDQDPQAIVKGYRFAIVGKDLPSEDEIADALDAKGVFEEDDPFGEMYKEVKSVGFLAKAINHLLALLKKDWKNSELALKILKDNATKSKEDKDNLKQAVQEVEANKVAYETTKKILENLGK